MKMKIMSSLFSASFRVTQFFYLVRMKVPVEQEFSIPQQVVSLIYKIHCRLIIC